MTAHRADLDEMAAVVDRLAARSAELEHLVGRLARQLDSLSSWSGLASAAHTDARAPWDSGFAAMRGALASMRATLAHAHDQYAAAAAHNLALWQELS